MADERKRQGGELFIVDNSDADWKVKRYLQEWADIAHSFDIATGFFDIGALLQLDGQWQKLEGLRILMGNEVSMRTKKALVAGIETAKKTLDTSIETEKEGNDFLVGVPAIVDAIQKGQIECRIYTKDKFHLGHYNVPQVYFILRTLPGVGAKKASMIARDFAMSVGAWFAGISRRLREDSGAVFEVSQKHFSEVPVDVHVVKVFGRMMGEFRRTPPRADFLSYSPDIQNFAKVAFPDFPSKLDELLWAAGREYCDDRNPTCSECPINDLPCSYASKVY